VILEGPARDDEWGEASNEMYSTSFWNALRSVVIPEYKMKKTSRLRASRVRKTENKITSSLLG